MDDEYIIEVAHKVPSFVVRNRKRNDGSLVAPYVVKKCVSKQHTRKSQRTRMVCQCCRGNRKALCLLCGGIGTVPYE